MLMKRDDMPRPYNNRKDTKSPLFMKIMRRIEVREHWSKNFKKIAGVGNNFGTALARTQAIPSKAHGCTPRQLRPNSSVLLAVAQKNRGSAQVKQRMALGPYRTCQARTYLETECRLCDTGLRRTPIAPHSSLIRNICTLVRHLAFINTVVTATQTFISSVKIINHSHECVQ